MSYAQIKASLKEEFIKIGYGVGLAIAIPVGFSACFLTCLWLLKTAWSIV